MAQSPLEYQISAYASIISSSISLNTKFTSVDAILGGNTDADGPTYLSPARASDVLRYFQSHHRLEPVLVLYDLDALDCSFRSVNRGFPNIGGVEFLHCYAIKSCPLSYILHRAILMVNEIYKLITHSVLFYFIFTTS